MSIFPKKSRFRRRHKRCYELAFKTLLDLADAGHADEVTLVHGNVLSSGWGSIDHAWLESDCEVYDAVAHEITSIDEYVAKRGAVAGRRYAFKEACANFTAANHYGPWHDVWETRSEMVARFAGLKAFGRSQEGEIFGS